MPNHIRIRGVQAAFGAAAASYDAHAALQREVAERLIAHLEFTRIAPQRILDIGCGTGYLTRLLRQKFPKAQIVALDLAPAMVQATRQSFGRRWPWQARQCFTVGDAAALPFAAGRFDLAISNLAMQWLPEPSAMLREMRRVLAPKGLLLFSTFGSRTLIELRQSLAAVRHDRAALVLPFPDVMSLGDALAGLDVELPVTDADLFTLTYSDTMALVRELKGLGASAAAIEGRPGGLYGRALLRELDAIYSATHRTIDGRVRASFEALYGQAWHAEPKERFACDIPIRSL